MEYFFVVTLLAISLASFSVLRFFLRKQKKRNSIQEGVDPRTGLKRVRIFDGEFQRGEHDSLYVLGQAIVTNAIFVESLIPLEKSVITEALDLLAKIHPLLRMKCEWEPSVRTGKDQRYRTEMKQFGLDYCEENIDGGKWKQKFEDELLQVFDMANGPLWRVVRLRESHNPSRDIYTNTFLFSFHHSISDEVSILKFFDQLLDIMDKIYRSNVAMETMQALPLLPNLEDLISHHTELPWWKVLYLKLTNKVTNSSFKFLKLFPPPLSRNPNLKLKTCILPGSLTQSQTSLLLKNCKTHKCTVTGVLGASVAMVIGKLVAMVTDSPTEFSVGITIPVNVRRSCKPAVNDNCFGLFIGLIAHSFAQPVGGIPDNEFWSQAGQLSNDIKQQLHDKKQFGICTRLKYGTLNLVNIFEKCSRDVKSAGRYDNSEVTNAGHYDFDKNRVFKITGAHFAAAQESIGPLLTLSAVTISGRLHLNVVYSSGAIYEEQACQFFKLFMELLIGIGCQGDE